jgi:hypothetical protein
MSTAVGDVDRGESRVIRKPHLDNGQLRHYRWGDSYGCMGSGIVPVIVNWLNWKVTYRILLVQQLVAFVFWYDAFIAIDFDWLGRWHVSWPVGLESTRNCLCYCYPLLGVLIKHLCFCNGSLSNADDFSFSGVAIRLRPIGLWNPHEIVSVTVNLNSIDISRHLADAISAPKSVWYITRIVTRRKGVIHEIPYAKHIWN